jgi:hypothetical protein
MLRRSSAAALLLFTGLASGRAVDAPRVPRNDPPSSLDPGPTGKVKLSHENRRAVSCAAQRNKKNEITCKVERVDADSATTLVLHPIAPARIAVKDKRPNVTVSFASQVGKQEKTLELGVGDWEIEWPGHDKFPRFRIHEGDDFLIKLRTDTGKCKKQKDECVLSTRDSSRECTVPDPHRPPG